MHTINLSFSIPQELSPAERRAHLSAAFAEALNASCDHLDAAEQGRVTPQLTDELRHGPDPRRSVQTRLSSTFEPSRAPHSPPEQTRWSYAQDDESGLPLIVLHGQRDQVFMFSHLSNTWDRGAYLTYRNRHSGPVPISASRFNAKLLERQIPHPTQIGSVTLDPALRIPDPEDT